ncbi:MAG: tetratricopeptide repeat protein [Bacteroidales bacterium]|nr:tetratricopeptide repeat protein [Bacteroidales bacterium]MDY2692901.1 tetratricopeptide repeat protein [Prevotella sp.]MDD5787940.1 tetratricopeptide repeat protein [Bacteroidales bacterium]MDD6898366.1 tetratricopeptide repeat protein [Bacteroidales bacterium]MDY4732767.1 tetratricopeptide repeat protein [Prevotella sp.]
MAKINEQQGNMNETLNAKEALFLKHRKNISIAIVVIILLVAGVICYNTYVSGPREQEASTALAKGQDYFANQQYDKALKGDGAGYAGFLSIASDYSNTDAGNLANLYAGLCYANMDKWNEAVQYLDGFSTSDDQMISPAAMAALGNAYAHLKQLDKAVECLKKAANMADSEAMDKTNNSISPVFLIQAGEILESQNKKDEALKIYQDIKTKYVNAPIAQEIDKYIERASAK